MNFNIKPFGFSLQVKVLDYTPVTNKDYKATRLTSTTLLHKTGNTKLQRPLPFIVLLKSI